MKFRRNATIAILAALVLGTASAHAQSVLLRAWRSAEGTPFTTIPANPGVGHQNTRVDGQEICCEGVGLDPEIYTGTPCGTFATPTPGEEITINTLWTDVLPDPVPETWTVDWTFVIQKVFSEAACTDGNVITLFEDEPIDYGDLSAAGFEPGDQVTFCVAAILQLPADLPLDGSVVRTAFGLTSPTGVLPTEYRSAFSIGTVPVP